MVITCEFHTYITLIAIAVIAQNSISIKKAISQIFGHFLRKVPHRFSHNSYIEKHFKILYFLAEGLNRQKNNDIIKLSN